LLEDAPEADADGVDRAFGAAGRGEEGPEALSLGEVEELSVPP